jgi:hypothetical protein
MEGRLGKRGRREYVQVLGYWRPFHSPKRPPQLASPTAQTAPEEFTADQSGAPNLTGIAVSTSARDHSPTLNQL